MNTSVNLHRQISEKIQLLSNKSGISKSEIVQRLMFSILENIEELNYDNRLIEYQDKLKKVNINGQKCSAYERVHFSVDSELSDLMEEKRYYIRMSISKLVCAAFLFFWKRLVKLLLGKLYDENLRNYEDNVYFISLKQYFIKRLQIKPNTYT